MNKDIAAPRCLVVLGVTDALNRLVQISGKDDSWLDFNGYDFVIAADSGQKIARKLGLKIDIYVGDFDSSIRPEGILRRCEGKTRTVEDLDLMSPQLLASGEDTPDPADLEQLSEAEREVLNQEPVASEIVILPEVKDLTDSEAAIDLAFERGFRDIDVLGGISGRIDHTMGNMGILSKYVGQARIRFFDGINYVTMLEPGTHLVKPRGYHYMGLIAFNENVVGLTIEGAKYEVTNFTLTPNATRGVSNEITGDYAQITFQQGKLLVINSRDIA